MARSAMDRSDGRGSPWRMLLLLALAELLVMATWFSASAVAPALAQEWTLDAGGRAWLTMAVQLGFVAGSFGSALLNLPDRISGPRLFAVSATLAGLMTALIPLVATGMQTAVLFRVLTGVSLAGVYPVGMKIMATWTRRRRGTAIGLLVGALTVGSASPHLINALGGVATWQPVLYIAAALAFAGALIAHFLVVEGPYAASNSPFNWREAGHILRDRPLLLTNVGYLGHMWELYAMWTWLPFFLAGSFALSGVSASWAGVVAFLAIALGGVGSLLAGRWADNIGRTAVTATAMIISGASAVIAGFLFGRNPWLVTVVVLIWGITVVADSAQFSAAASELADSAYMGTTLTLQTSMGFLLTLLTIRLVPALVAWAGWGVGFSFLALGPMVGTAAMLQLRRMPAAQRIAGGRR